MTRIGGMTEDTIEIGEMIEVTIETGEMIEIEEMIEEGMFEIKEMTHARKHQNLLK